MKKILFFLLLLPLFTVAQQEWIDATGDTIRVERITKTSTSPVWGVVGVKDSTYSVRVTVPVFGTTYVNYTYSYDTVVVRKKQTQPTNPGPVTPPPVTNPPIAGTEFKFSITQQPLANMSARQFAGLEQWNDQNYAAPTVRKQDKYFRFSWSMLESGKDQYVWTKFDQEMNDAIDKGQKFSFGIMTHYPDAVSPHRLNYDGGYAVYPLYLHNMMQAEPVKDWKASNGAWVPNWNSEAYITRLLALHKAIDRHMKETVYKGVRYSDNINYIDIRGYGAFGEWHSYTIVGDVSQYPSGTRATLASLKRIVDAHTEGFPDYPLVVLVAAFDADRLGNTKNPAGIASYVLRARNKWGLIGWRRDNWGATDSYLKQYTSGNTKVVDGMRLDTAIMNRWKYAPVVGEPCCNANYADLKNQMLQAHAVSVGNGNYSSGDATMKNNVLAAGNASGHLITITGGSFKGGTITVDWENKGNTPSYEAWEVYFELRQGSTVKWSGKSAHSPTMKLPGTWSTTDSFTGLPTGEFDLHVVVKNSVRTYLLPISSKVATIKL